MSRPLKLHIVEQARALIADEQHWCRGDLARNINGEEVCPTAASAVKRCGLGAVIAAAYQLTNDLGAAHDLAFKALRPSYGTATLVVGTSHSRSNGSNEITLSQFNTAMPQNVVSGGAMEIEVGHHEMH